MNLHENRGRLYQCIANGKARYVIADSDFPNAPFTDVTEDF